MIDPDTQALIAGQAQIDITETMHKLETMFRDPAHLSAETRLGVTIDLTIAAAWDVFEKYGHKSHSAGPSE